MNQHEAQAAAITNMHDITQPAPRRTQENDMNISYTFKNRNGSTTTKTLSVDEAIDRVVFLDNAEANTLQYAPTDSGNTRFSYNAEAVAIREAASKTF